MVNEAKYRTLVLRRPYPPPPHLYESCTEAEGYDSFFPRELHVLDKLLIYLRLLYCFFFYIFQVICLIGPLFFTEQLVIRWKRILMYQDLSPRG